MNPTGQSSETDAGLLIRFGHRNQFGLSVGLGGGRRATFLTQWGYAALPAAGIEFTWTCLFCSQSLCIMAAGSSVVVYILTFSESEFMIH